MQTKQSPKRIIMTPGFKGGVGKTALAKIVADLAHACGTSITLFDGDPDNRGAASFSACYPGECTRIDVRDPLGLDALADAVSANNTVLVDLGAGKGAETFSWFDVMHKNLASAGVQFTLLAPLVRNAASVTSLLSWATHLQDRVSYIVALNAHGDRTLCFAPPGNYNLHFRDWTDSEPAKAFQQSFKPTVIDMPSMPLQSELDNHLLSARRYLLLGEYSKLPPPLNSYGSRIRVRSQLQTMFRELKKAEHLLFPCSHVVI